KDKSSSDGSIYGRRFLDELWRRGKKGDRRLDCVIAGAARTRFGDHQQPAGRQDINPATGASDLRDWRSLIGVKVEHRRHVLAKKECGCGCRKIPTAAAVTRLPAEIGQRFARVKVVAE